MACHPLCKVNMNRLQEGQVFSCYKYNESRCTCTEYQLLTTLNIPRGDFYLRVFDDLCIQGCRLVAILITVKLLSHRFPDILTQLSTLRDRKYFAIYFIIMFY